MSGVRMELEILANDCEELAVQSEDDKGMQRALLSIVYRIRFAASKLKETPNTPSGSD